MAAKAHLRNQRPVVIAISTNDALGNNAKNLGQIMNVKNVYLVPFFQDDPIYKTNSLIADMDKITDTVLLALEGRQIQPLVVEKKE
jgi:dipicolinate synthase subunit B